MCFPAFVWNRISSERLEAQPRRYSLLGRSDLRRRGPSSTQGRPFCPSAEVVQERIQRELKKENKRSPNPHSSPICGEGFAKRKVSGKRPGSLSLPRLMYKKEALPHPHPMRSMRNAELNSELEAGSRRAWWKGHKAWLPSAHLPRCSGFSDWRGNVPETL